MWKTLACAVLIVTGVVVMPAATRAQPATTDAKLAEELAQQAFDAYQKGEFGSAITLYKRAYQASAAGVIMFNIANIYDKKLKDKEQALEYYRKYLRSGDTEPELVKRASERIDTVRAEIESGKQSQLEERNATSATNRPNGSTSTPPSAMIVQKPPAPPPIPRTRMQNVGLLAGAIGLVGLGTSGVYGWMAKSENDKAVKGCNGRSACPDEFGLGSDKAAHHDALISTVSFAVGAALVTTGVVLYIYGPKKEDHNRTTVGITPQLGGIAFTGAW